MLSDLNRPSDVFFLTHIHFFDTGFVVRLKQGTPLGVPWVEPYLTTTAGEVSLPDTPVAYHGHDWRLVQSDYRPNMKQEEPWFLLTNIPKEKRTGRQVLRTYAKRFEIEEYFKEVKWVEGYEWHRMKRPQTARTVFRLRLSWLVAAAQSVWSHSGPSGNQTDTPQETVVLVSNHLGILAAAALAACIPDQLTLVVYLNSFRKRMWVRYFRANVQML